MTPLAHRLCALLLAATATALAPLPAQADPGRTPVAVDGSEGLPLRILTRPGASLYSDSTGASVLKGNLPTFSSYYVYTRPQGEELYAGTGWYEVGTDDQGAIAGWIKADDLFEWKQAMCLTYTHPDGRSPVLMFDDEDYLSTLAGMDPATRAPEVDKIYSSIDQAASSGQPLPGDFPVISMEPKMAVDNTANFTLMPILDFRGTEFEGREARLLEVAAVSSAEKDRKASDLRTNTDYLQAATDSSEQHAGALADIKFDVVWCIDTTRSMGPYIERVRNLMGDISRNIAADASLTDRVRFGAWGYRDSAEIQGLEYVTHNFTPQLQVVDEFVKTMAEVKETKVDSVTFDEDVYSGLRDAIEQTQWRDNAIRIVILVGDAPAHQPGHKWNATGLDASTMRELATAHKVNLYALHINPPKAKKQNKVGQGQFRTLSLNPGNDTEMYWSISAKDIEEFSRQSQRLTDNIVGFAKNAVAEFSAGNGPAHLAADTAAPAAAAAQPDAQPAAQSRKKPDAPSDEALRQSVRAALVTWLGNAESVEAPRDIEAWVLDKDLKAGTRQALDVNLLMTKAQLDSISTLLSEVLTAGETNQVSGEDFFTSLQAASAVAARDPERLAQASSIADSGMVPAFLKGLPYKSRLMEMNNELWESFGPDEQNAFLSSIESKISAYKSIHDDPSLWVALNAGDDADDHVAAVPLELLP
ncbi:MAG: VWA domain-containing protein [Succinivibrionaceae bacterium]|nr:VWA domain-containing protein [Succinivibrionaceae bacterium]